MRTFSLLLLITLATSAGAEPQVSRRSATDQALVLYGELTGRTVLRPGKLPAVDGPIELPSPDTPGYREQASERIIKYFDGVGVRFKPLGERFVVVATEGSSLQLAAPPERKPQPESSNQSDFPKGTIKFPGADLDQVLEIYSVLRDCTILRPARLPATPVFLQTESDLTREEIIYAMDVAFALNGIAAVEDGERFVQVVPLAMASRVEALSPERDPADELIEAKSIPKFNGRLFPSRGSTTSAISSKPKMESGSAVRMLEYYATLLEVNAVPAGSFSRVPVVFRATTALSKPELLYAMRTVLGLNGLKIQHDENGAVRLGYDSEARPPIVQPAR